MINLDELNNKFCIEGGLTFTKGENDLIFLNISNQFATTRICLYGAHIMNFTPTDSKDILWTSPESLFQVGKPIRGGIPVCFPWFGPHKTDQSKPQHGFGRLMYWDVIETAVTPDSETLVRLKLCSSDETRFYWPYDFCAEIIIVVGKSLSVALKVTNTSSTPLNYSCALHTYYNISDIENINIYGLKGARYHNHLEQGDHIQESPNLEIHKAETRHYHDTEATCIIDDPGFGRKILAAKSGSRITTVWNPWAEACAQIGDLPDDGYKTFICIESVNSFDDLIILNPGESHETSAIISLEK